MLLLISIGALYGVLEKTGKYRAWIEKIVKNLKGREFLFLVITSFVIALLTSVFDYGFGLLIFFPLLISILLSMGYNKVTVIASTFGAMLVGTIGSTVGYNTTGTIRYPPHIVATRSNATALSSTWDHYRSLSILG
jgi:uncharacterized ion transporter superfamily protein YfcC